MGMQTAQTLSPQSQGGIFTTGLGSGAPNQPVPLNSMGLPLNIAAGDPGSPEARAAAFAKQQAELQARIASRAAAAGKPTEFSLSQADENGNAVTYARWNPDMPSGGGSIPQQSTPFVTGGGSSEVRTMAGPQNQVVPQVGPSPTPQNQTPPMTQSKGKGGSTTNSATSGQPAFGQPNMYPNTVGQWDNASIQPRQSRNGGGKGKGY
jgi:hypothetical protein